MGRRPDLQDEIQDAEKPEAGWYGCRERQEARLKALPVENWALPDRTVPTLDEEPPHRPVLVVPLPDADKRPCPEWKAQQKILRTEVRKESGKWKSRGKIWDILADRRCG